MWNERQRTQKIGFELERVKRGLRDQDEVFVALMREHFVTDEELAAARTEMDRRRDEAGSEPATALGVRGYVVRG